MKWAAVMGLDLLQDLAIVMVVAGAAGWICQRIGLSAVVGFLLAGIVIGPHTPPFALVSDLPRIHTLSQLGIVFLMFSIGMGLTLKRLRRMGTPIVIATALGAILVLMGARFCGSALGWSTSHGLFLAAILMVSSSAIISKVLHEINAVHEPAARLAMGVTVLEDIVAVVMLTLLASVAQAGGASAPPLWQTLGLIAAFVITLAIAGLLLVPPLLARMARELGADLQTILVVGLVLGVALLAAKAGYSLALGAFLLGAIISETPQHVQVERYLQGMRDVFTAVFFASIGMLMDVKLVAESWPLVLAFGALTLLGRTVACSGALVLTGVGSREAVRAGLMLTPVGEFSFIIAQLGVTSGAVPATFYPLAVGVSLFTALAAPVLIRHSDGISAGVEKLEPRFLKEILRFYHRLLQQMQARQQGSELWQLSRARLTKVATGMLFITGVLIFSQPVLERLEPLAPEGSAIRGALPIVSWTAVGTLVLAPLVAVWRNLSALAKVYAQVVTRGRGQEALLRPFVERALQLMAAAGLVLWIWSLLPLDVDALWTAGIVIALLVALLVTLRHRLMILHGKVEVELDELLVAREEVPAHHAWIEPHREWNLHAHEIVLPDHAALAGRTIAEIALRGRFGCSVAGVERNGFPIANPGPDFVLYPGDKLLVLATPEQVEAARPYLTRGAEPGDAAQLLDEIVLAAVPVPPESAVAGKLLVELDIPAATGVQIVGIERGEARLLNPGPFQGIEAGDQLLALGTEEQLRGFRRWLNAAAKSAG